MGNVSSRPDEGAALFLRDQNRCEYAMRSQERLMLTWRRTVTISALSVSNSRRRTILSVAPNAFPATRIFASRDLGDNAIVEYVQVASLGCRGSYIC